jgi:hypothetical protein
MNYYLLPYAGSGTEEDPYRPEGVKRRPNSTTIQRKG